MSIVIACGSMIPLPMVFATFSERYAPAKFRIPAPITARRGEMERVATDVAIAFAASWKPLVKSNSSAIATTMASSNTDGPQFPSASRSSPDRHHLATVCSPPGYGITASWDSPGRMIFVAARPPRAR